MIRILKITPKNFNEIIKEVIKYIRQGKVIVLPTDTVYGLAADAANQKAVKRLFKIKKRKLTKPIPIFVRDMAMVRKLADIDKAQEKFLKENWPGKITAVLKRKERKKMYGLDKKTIALRIPNYKLINILVKKLNQPLTGTSANISGKPATTKIKEVIKQFKNPRTRTSSVRGRQKFQPDLIIDAGNLRKSRPSKVIDLTEKKIKILRH